MVNYIEGKITVYTPTYNRGYCLNKLYESLLRQTNKNFDWLIVDDGSIDNTKELVMSWIKDNKIDIKYIYQENAGKMHALNVAYERINAELNVCVDSDDFLVDEAIDLILTKWKAIRDNKQLAGLVGLDRFEDGKLVGTNFPENIKTAKYREFETKYNIKGDKKFVYRTDIVHDTAKYPMIDGEKFPALGYLYRLIDQNYDLYLLNTVLCVVEYLDDGISKNKFTQFKKSPNSFAFYRLERMRMAVNYKDKFKNAIHYVSSCIFAKRNIFKNNPYWLTTLLAFPLGILLNIYILKSKKKGVV